MDDSRVTNSVFLLTGATGGIGRAIARTLMEHGARVALCGRDEHGLDVLADDLANNDSSRILTHAGDLAGEDAPRQAVERVAAWGSGLHGVISCAGADRFSFFTRQGQREFEEAIDVNLLAPIRLVRAALPYLEREERSSVVFINTIAARAPAPPRGTSYVSAKAGLLHFAEALFAEIRDAGVRVSSILPDLTDTPMVPEAWNYDRSSLIRPESVARAVLFAVTMAPDTCLTELHLRPQPSLRTMPE